jgi:hypothetical protein
MFDYQSPEQFKEECGYEINGSWFPRVTKIVSIKAKPALYHYYAEAANFAEAAAQTKKSAEEGSKIHESAEKILIGQKPAIDPLIAPAIQAFAEFLDQKNIQVDPAHVEKRLVNYEHRYAGTIDALALIDGKFGVLDIKTSQAIYRDYNLQTAAYMDALIRDPLLRGLQTRWILRIDQIKNCVHCGAALRLKGGREKVRPPKQNSCSEGQHEWSDFQGVIELKEFPYWREDFEAFLGAKKLWEWENQYWLDKIGY